jgi:Arc/MetJ-type ribon-helix-helix transcriptional regulator
MTITLGPDQEKLIADALETGAYRDTNEVIERALEMLHSEDEWLSAQKKEIADKLERAFAQSERGEVYSPEESRADMTKRKAQWLSERTHRLP